VIKDSICNHQNKGCVATRSFAATTTLAAIQCSEADEEEEVVTEAEVEVDRQAVGEVRVDIFCKFPAVT
jgi:hypothetical protein